MTTQKQLGMAQIKKAIKSVGHDPKDYRIGWQSTNVCSIDGIGKDKEKVRLFSEQLKSIGLINEPVYHCGSIKINRFQ